MLTLAGTRQAVSGGLLISHINIIVCPMSTLINTCLGTNSGGNEARGGTEQGNMINCQDHTYNPVGKNRET